MVSKRPLEALLSCYKLVPVLALQKPTVAHSALLQATKYLSQAQNKAKARPGLLVDSEHLLSPFPKRKEKLRLTSGELLGFGEKSSWEVSIGTAAW